MKVNTVYLLTGRIKGWYIWYNKIDFLRSQVLDSSGHAGVTFALSGTAF